MDRDRLHNFGDAVPLGFFGEAVDQAPNDKCAQSRDGHDPIPRQLADGTDLVCRIAPKKAFKTANQGPKTHGSQTPDQADHESQDEHEPRPLSEPSFEAGNVACEFHLKTISIVMNFSRAERH